MPTSPIYNLNQVYAPEPLATGVVFVAPLGTTGPTDAITPIASLGSGAWVDLGYAGSDGFVEKLDHKTTIKYAFGGKPIKVLQSEFNATLEFTLEESLNAAVLSAVFGPTNVVVTAATPTTGTSVKVFKNSRKFPQQSWIIDTYDDELGSKYRNYVAVGQIMNIADIKVVHTDTIEYKVTIECFESPNGNDNIVTFTNDDISSTGAQLAPLGS